MDINRKVSFLILKNVEEHKAYSNISTNNNIANNKPDSPSFVRELVYGVLRNETYLDFIISGFVKTPIKKLNINDLTIIRMGLYQLLFMDSVPEYAAVNESVVLAKKYARGREGFVNGVLRQYIRDKDYVELPDRAEDEILYLSIKYSYEKWIVEMLIKDYGIERAESLMVAGNKIPNISIRANTLKINREELKHRLVEKGFTITDSERFDNMLFIKGNGILDGVLFNSGMFSIQDEAAYMAVKTLDPMPGEYVVDVCAAPGGKTMAIAEKMENLGTVCAIDYYKKKLIHLEAAAKRLGITIIDMWSWDATRADPDILEKADRVLVDVPCSGVGTVRKKPEIKYKEWDEDFETLPEKQLDILTSSAKYVKRGGILVYSTCTIFNRENEEVIKKFLRFDKDFEKIETIKLLPDTDGTDGFFICKMKRKDSIV